MHGHVPAPPQPRPAATALVVIVRVIFVSVTLLSIGILSWVTMLRIAIMRRRPLDWALFWGTCGLVVLTLVEIGTGPDDNPGTLGYIALAALFTLAAGVTTHYLVVDIGHYRAASAARAASGVPTAAPLSAPPYGLRPYGYVPPQPPAYPHPGIGAQPSLPQQPHPQRIDRVRAELDELSEWLRKEQGR
ncbi:hypothetical protein ABZU86_21960 [Streptomyces sp. NPDC005271]|uniref:hypothetical protein n=1 Tax=unclassified Streptomyces TaxID=2593676 RepID=UPI0033A840AB